MEKVVLWDCGNIGREAYEKLSNSYEIIAYGDNDKYKQNLIYRGIPIIGLEKLKNSYLNCKVIVSIANYYTEAERLYKYNIPVIGYYDSIQEKVLPWRKISWKDIECKKIRLYAGDIYENFEHYPDDYVICLSLSKSDYRTIRHDIRYPYPLKDKPLIAIKLKMLLNTLIKIKYYRL